MNKKEISKLYRLSTEVKHMPFTGIGLVKDGRIYANNLDVEMSYPFPIKGYEFTLSLDELRKAEFNTIEIDDNFLVLKKGNNTTVLKINKDTKDYPKLGLHDPSNIVGEFTQVDILKLATNFVSDCESTPTQMGVFVDTDIVAINGIYLYYHKNESNIRNMIVPKSAITLLDEDSYLVSVQMDDECTTKQNNAIFKGSNQEIWIKLIEGKYPDYNSVIPKQCSAIATIKASDLLPVLENALKLIPKKRNNTLFFEFTDESLMITVPLFEDGDVKFWCTIPNKLNIDNTFRVGIRGDLLYNMLKKTKTQEVNLYLPSIPSRGICINNFGLIMGNSIYGFNCGWENETTLQFETEYGKQ